MDLTEQNVTTSIVSRWGRFKNLWSAIRYLFSKAVLIAVTIFLGVFGTILIANQPTPYGPIAIMRPQIEANIESQIERYIRAYRNNPSLQTGDVSLTAEELREVMREENGLNLPYLQRHLLWTMKALKFDWGRITETTIQPLYGRHNLVDIRSIILQYFPNTLLLVGTANLLVFLIGIPLSLHLARNHDKLLDRLVSLFSPLSSVPSWVIGILLLSIFAVELRWLPISGMFDNAPPPESTVAYLLMVLRHMILPVAAIIISLLFQLVYTWRTFFVIYSEEDYVELAKAKGLSSKILQRKYILRPSLPFIITSFTLVLVGFWQMTMALEVVFDWPGIGWLYIEKALPNYWGFSMYPGEVLIAIGIVVIFAYLLGIVVFLLDIVYVLIDPRVHITGSGKKLRVSWNRSIADWWGEIRGRLGSGRMRETSAPVAGVKTTKRPMLERMAVNTRRYAHDVALAWRFFFRELRRYPSAIFGLVIILLMIVGSVVAVVAYPYAQIAREWDTERLSGRARVPRLAKPVWFNYFRDGKMLSVAEFDESHPAVTRTVEKLSNGWTSVSAVYTIDYQYADFPQEMFLYIDARFSEKRPYMSLQWITPDGREIDLKSISVNPSMSYDFSDNIPAKRLVALNPNWQAWFNFGQVDTTPEFYVLFADPFADQPRHLKGTYQLKVDGLLFEDDSDLTLELLLLGQVYGVAGTDYLRRELIVPLLWGMPFALIFGLTGAFVTTILAMIIAATGVWFGGWVDSLIQRLTEANMILPVLAVSVLAYALLGVNLWVILAVIILLNVFGSPAKTFRSAFLQVKEEPYIEAARAYGASNFRIIMNYLIPRIIPVLIPQLVTLIPGFVFLEATLGLFNIKSTYPTWGRIIYQGLSNGALYGSRFWVLEPIALLLLTGLAFAVLGAVLERILNPRLLTK
jgi:peptide/nickel transport system permease protein